MTRRAFIGLLGGAAAWPIAAVAQQARPLVGFLHAGSLGPSADQESAFRKGLDEAGFVTGQNITIEHRWADGKYGVLPALANDLVQRRAAVITAGGGPAAVRAAIAATTTIPVVFVSGADPVKYGLVASFNRPGGNVTGAVFFNPGLVSKRLELLRELVPTARAVSYLVNPANPEAELETKDVQAAAGSLGIDLHVQHASSEQEIDSAFRDLRKLGVTALLLGSDPFLFGRREQMSKLAKQLGLPAIGTTREYPAAGFLASYGNDIPDAYRQAAVYVGRVLKGEKPSDLPVVQSTKFELLINLKTARALGIDVPSTLLARADEVIE